MKLADLQKKKHMFKKRINVLTYKKPNLLCGNVGLYNLNLLRYELVYLRFLKKIFRQRHIKRKVTFKKCKFWFFLKPNYILTNKSTNARMGAGTGAMIRLAIRLKPYTIFANLQGYSPFWIKTLYSKARFRYPFKFLICI